MLRRLAPDPGVSSQAESPADQVSELLEAAKHTPNTAPRVSPAAGTLARDAYIARLDGVLSNDECQALIALASATGFDHALVNAGGGRQVLARDVRRSSRAMIDSPRLANAIWSRIEPFVPAVWPPLEYERGPVHRRRVVGLNERLRFLKYETNDFFDRHGDGSYRSPTGERSFVTLLIYLNGGGEFEGGRTMFWGRSGERHRIEPDAGTALLHDHRILHASAVVKSGVKYALRTDVMYAAPPNGMERASV